MADPGFVTVVVITYNNAKKRYAYHAADKANLAVYEFLSEHSKNVNELLEAIKAKKQCKFKINNKMCKLVVMQVSTTDKLAL